MPQAIIAAPQHPQLEANQRSALQCFMLLMQAVLLQLLPVLGAPLASAALHTSASHPAVSAKLRAAAALNSCIEWQQPGAIMA
jgi:hypothetical protein